MTLFITWIVVIISQCVHLSKHYFVYFKYMSFFCQSYLRKADKYVFLTLKKRFLLVCLIIRLMLKCSKTLLCFNQRYTHTFSMVSLIIFWSSKILGKKRFLRFQICICELSVRAQIFFTKTFVQELTMFVHNKTLCTMIHCKNFCKCYNVLPLQ
jgi:hypothetical protein